MAHIAFISNSIKGEYTGRLNWAREFIRHGHQATFIVPEGDEEYRQLFENEGVSVLTYVMSRKGRNVFREILSAISLRRIISRNDFDIIHSFGHKANLYTLFAARTAGRSNVFTHVTGLGYAFAEKGLKARLTKRIVLLAYRINSKRAKKVIFQNQDDRAVFRGVVGPDKCEVIRGTGVDIDYFSRGAVDKQTVSCLKRDLGISGSPLVITIVARLLRDKGINEFIDAAKLLTTRGHTMLFIVVGWIDKGNPSSLTEEQVELASRSSAIRFLGERREIREILFLTSVYVLPSYREGIPRTVIEAMAMGLPVVTTDTVGCRDAVEDGKNGFLVPMGDPGAIADAVERLASDDSLRARMGQAGRERAVREFSARYIAGKIMEMYDDL